MEQSKEISYRQILSISDYRKLILSNVVNRFGDSIDSIAFTWIVYQITHSAAWSAIVFGVNFLPNVVVQPFAGAIVEKMDKKRVLIITNLLRAVVITAFAALYIFGHINPVVMVVTTLIITTIESFDRPASSAFAANVVRKEHMTVGISLNKMLSSAATLIGTGIGGVILARAGATAAMCIDIVTFVVTAILIGLMKSGSKAFLENSNNKAGNSEERIIRIFKDGIAYTAKTPVVRNFCILCVVLNFMLVPINALQAPIASEIFKTGAEILSFAGVFSALGGIAGSALLPVLSRGLSPLRITCLGTAALGIGLLGIPCGGVFVGNRTACYITMSICFFVLTIAASLIGGVLGIQFMKSVDQEYMARASAVFDATSTVAMPIGSFGISALVTYMSTSNIMIFSAVFSAAVLLALVLMKPELEKREVETPNAA
jgi:MFS family permease